MVEVIKIGANQRFSRCFAAAVGGKTFSNSRFSTISSVGVACVSTVALQQGAGKYGYKPRVTIFGSSSDIVNPRTIACAERFGRELAQSKYAINVNGNLSGLAKVISKASLEIGGEVFGVALKEENIIPGKQFTEFEAYTYDYEMWRRLLELGDIFVFLPGIKIDNDDLEVLRQTNKKQIFIGDQTIKHDTETIVARDLEGALDQVKKHFAYLEESNYHSPIYYPALDPKAYYDHIMQNTNSYEMLYENTMLTVFPGVFPSNRFRSSKAMGKLASEVCQGKVVADICCGLGSIGIAAYNAGAKHVVLGDINPDAVENTQYNIDKLGLNPSNIKVYKSNVFSGIPDEYKGKIDVMFCSPPFFKEKLIGDEELLMHAFLADGKEGGVIDRFLRSAKDYLAPDGVIYLTFSNKDQEHLQFLEDSLTKYGYKWELKLIKNRDAISDTRIYRISCK